MDNGKLVKFEMLPREGEYALSADGLEKLRMLACTPGLIDRLLQCVDQIPRIQQCVTTVEDKCRNISNRCDAFDMFCEGYICPGNVNFSQRTLDEYSDNAQVNLEQIVSGFPNPPYVAAFPVGTNQIIRLTHKPRPGYTPKTIAIDLNISGGGSNYLDFELQMFLVPGGVASDQGLEIGSKMRGNQFLNKDGTQIHLPFPAYRNQSIDVGSLETLAIEIRNTGAANLDSAFITVYYDNRAFYELCKKRCGCLVPGASAPK